MSCLNTDLKNTMIYIIGFAGFIGGFIAGQLLLSYLLRDYSKAEILELMKEPAAKTRYGMVNWLTALFGALACIWFYMKFL